MSEPEDEGAPSAALAAAELEAIYRAHREPLLRLARRLVGPAEAESVIQEVFVELLRNAALRARWRGGSMAAWISEITRRKALEYLRRHQREIPRDAGGDDGRDVGASAHPEPSLQARQMVERFLDRHVQVSQRPFFVLRFLEHHTQAEAAAALGLARSTLEGWEHKLAAALRRFIVEGE